MTRKQLVRKRCACEMSAARYRARLAMVDRETDAGILLAERLEQQEAESAAAQSALDALGEP